jgi:hypothetical protein
MILMSKDFAIGLLKRSAVVVQNVSAGRINLKIVYLFYEFLIFILVKLSQNGNVEWTYFNIQIGNLI